MQEIIFVILILTDFTRSDVHHDLFQEVEADPPMENAKSPINLNEQSAHYWLSQAINTLGSKLNYKLNTNRAKNVIFFLGDGMSITTITAARIYKGQLLNKTGEEEKLFFETFPFTGLSKTYCVNKQVADSACSSTAYMTGVKTNLGVIGVTGNVQKEDCELVKKKENRVSSILTWAQDAGKATGIVTNTRITDASPAGGYAHVSYRGMESDKDTQKHFNSSTCNYDIAQQLIGEKPGKDLRVIMGGGRDKFLPLKSSVHGTGIRLEKDLIAVWKENKLKEKVNGVYLTDVQELEKVDILRTDYLLGLFADKHMNFHTNKNENEPTLWKMTEKAIQILQKENKGFFLFVEGGKIDYAHHSNQARRALDETLEFDKAIEIAARLTNEEDTLIVVTADHAHTMTISGYPNRGNDILGLHGKAKDELPYSVLSYANGPGYHKESSTGSRYDLRQDNMTDVNYSFPGLVPKNLETHGGDDVAVYARGPWAHLFSGNYEQNYIPVAEAFAANIGPSSSLQSPSNLASCNASFDFYVFRRILLVLIILFFN